MAKFLSTSGLTVVPSGSPFLVRATGSSAQIQRTFHTTLNSFKDPQGTKYFANSTPVYVPSSLAGAAMGVIGLTNTQRNAKNTKNVPHFNNTMRPGAKASATTNCETSYPTVAQLFSHRVDKQPLTLGYGAGPGCSGLTPSQENSLYGAPNLGARAKGKGVDIAVFELSAYQHSDIATWAHQFYGPSYTPPLVDVNVDGGPLNPECPVGDTCPPRVRGLRRRHRGGRGHRDAAGHRARRQPPHRLQRAERLHRPDRARRVVRDRQGQRGRLGQLQLGRLRERRGRRLRPGREHHLPADGRAGAGRVRRRR